MVQSAPSRRPNPRWGALLIGLALVLALASQCVPRRADLSLWAQASALRNAPAVARAPLHPVRATAAASAAAARAAPGPQRPSPASAAAPQAAPPSPAASLSGALLRRGADVVAAVLATAGLVLWRGACRRRALVLHSARPPIAMCAATSEKAEEAAALAKRETHLPKVLGSVAAAAVFGAGVLLFKGLDAGEEYFAAYLIEYSLSIDNLFVFLVIFKYFQCTPPNQERVLNYGLITAAVLRFLFLLLGEELLQKFSGAIVVFGGILLYSSYTILSGGGDDEEEDEDLSDNNIVKFVRSFLTVSDRYDGNRFTTTVDGKTIATPLLLVLAVVELSDVVFATDSVPAVLGTTQDLFVAYTSNLFAIVGLRSLFFLLEESLDQFKYIEPAIGAVLGFIGAKIVAEFAGYDISTTLSLGVVASLLGSGVLLSLNDPWAEAEAEEDR